MQYDSILQYGINEIKLIEISQFAIWTFTVLWYRVEVTGLLWNEWEVTPFLGVFLCYLSLKGIKVCQDF